MEARCASDCASDAVELNSWDVDSTGRGIDTASEERDFLARRETRAMSTTAKVTLAEYDAIVLRGDLEDRRVELVRGEIREMSPIGAAHERAVDILTEWIFEVLPKRKVWIRVQNSVGLPGLESVPEPDIGWVARRDYSKARPVTDDVLLVIEVAHSSLKYDLGAKAQLYAEAGIGDYWVVNLIDRCVEVFRDPTPEGYRHRERFSPGQSVQPLAFPEARLIVDDVFTASDDL